MIGPRELQRRVCLDASSMDHAWSRLRVSHGCSRTQARRMKLTKPPRKPACFESVFGWAPREGNTKLGHAVALLLSREKKDNGRV